MNRYYVSELYPHALHTVGILREDLEVLLAEGGYLKIQLKNSISIVNKCKQYAKAFTLAIQLPKNSVVFFHFPLRSRVIRFFLSLIKKRGICIIGFIHDLEGFRDKDKKILEEELFWLQYFKVIIAQNKVMKNWVDARLPQLAVISIDFYDYLAKEFQCKPRFISNEIAFAGNLSKAPFIYKLDLLTQLKFHIYGQTLNIAKPTNTIYHGLVEPRSLHNIIQGSYGLVWDGPDVESCTEIGEYLKINMPYKMALYTMAELPLIVWNQSAMAEWVLENQIGIAVHSLMDLPTILNKVKEEHYEKMIKNLQGIKLQITKGTYFKIALKNAEEFCGYSSSLRTAKKAS